MKTIKENKRNEIIIKNSRFITLLIKLTSNKINSYLEEIKKEYPMLKDSKMFDGLK